MISTNLPSDYPLPIVKYANSSKRLNRDLTACPDYFNSTALAESLFIALAQQNTFVEPKALLARQSQKAPVISLETDARPVAGTEY